MSAVRAILRALSAREPIEAAVALVAAHPDDETIGAGASLHLFPKMLLVHVTDGGPRDLRDARAAGFGTVGDYAAARRGELASALHAGNATPELVELGAPDQEASSRLAELAGALAACLARFRPGCVITHPYEGGHPDHDAVCFITQMACRRLDPIPAILEMTSYHAGWSGELIVGGFLGDPPAAAIALSAEERARKRAMIDCYATQRETLAPFPLEREAFRVAPAYDFSQPPHPGTLWYERHAAFAPTGMTGARWRELAREALAACGAR